MDGSSISEIWDIVKTVALGALRDVALVIFVWAIIGLLLGIFIVWLLRRLHVFKRPRVWKWFTRLLYVYIPMLTFFFAISLGALNGVHRVVDSAIDDSSDYIIEYAQLYLPQAQTLIIENGDIGIAAISNQINVELVMEKGAFLGSVVKIIGHGLDELLLLSTMAYYDVEFDVAGETLGTLVRYDLSDPEMFRDKSLYSFIPNFLHNELEQAFIPLYLGIVFTYSPFYLLPLIEISFYILFYRLLWKRIFGKHD